MDGVEESVFKIVVEFLEGSLLGKVLLTVVCLLILAAPFLRFCYKEYKQAKVDREARDEAAKKEKEEAIKRRARAEEETRNFREMVSGNLQKMELTNNDINGKINTLSSEVKAMAAVKDQLTASTNRLNETVVKLESEISETKEVSDKQDIEIRDQINQITKTLTKVSEDIVSVGESAKKVDEDIKIIFEGENNDFRTFITSINDNYVLKGVPIPRDVKQQLRVKYSMYKKRNGNGWAEELYKDIMAYADSKPADP